VWQVLLAPVILLATTRRLLWPWLTGQLYTARPLATLLTGAALAVGSVAAGLWYRTAIIPDIGEPFDVRAFRARLTPPEENEAGKQLRRAIEAFAVHEGRVAAPEAVWLVPGGGVHDHSRELAAVLSQGWSAAPAELGPWLDRMCAAGWAKQLAGAVQLPLGLVEDPRTASLGPGFQVPPLIQNCSKAALVLSARAVQLEARGDMAAALDHLGTVLALSRQLRHQALLTASSAGLEAEQNALAVFNRWLGGQAARPLLRRAAAELEKHEARLPPLADCVRAQYVALTNRGEDPVAWLRPWERDYGTNAMMRAEIELLALAWQAPWERDRVARTVRAVTVSMVRTASEVGPRGADFSRAQGYPPELHWSATQSLWGFWTNWLISGSYLRDWERIHSQAAQNLQQLRTLRERATERLKAPPAGPGNPAARPDPAGPAGPG
jgi:hypothetical protein